MNDIETRLRRLLEDVSRTEASTAAAAYAAARRLPARHRVEVLELLILWHLERGDSTIAYTVEHGALPAEAAHRLHATILNTTRSNTCNART